MGSGQLANVDEIPVVDPSFHDERLKQIFQYYSVQSRRNGEKELHVYAAELLEKGLVKEGVAGFAGAELAGGRGTDLVAGNKPG